jgi:hypothetical protein
MDNKLQEALKKANEEVEKAGIKDPELRKIAFSKAVDLYLHSDQISPQTKQRGKATDTIQADFWARLGASADMDEKKLRDVFSMKGEQVLLVLPCIPGETKADKQRNLAALVLFAYGEGLGQEWVSSALVAEAAQHSKLYDTSKFAKNLNHDWFRHQGVTKGKKHKLSGPGLSNAKTILRSIVG